MTSNIFLLLFCVAMIANAIALVRHWRMMRVFQIMLTNFVETQRQLNEIMEAEQRKKP
jgi:hypothetical protein